MVGESKPGFCSNAMQNWHIVGKETQRVILTKQNDRSCRLAWALVSWDHHEWHQVLLVWDNFQISSSLNALARSFWTALQHLIHLFCHSLVSSETAWSGSNDSCRKCEQRVWQTSIWVRLPLQRIGNLYIAMVFDGIIEYYWSFCQGFLVRWNHVTVGSIFAEFRGRQFRSTSPWDLTFGTSHLIALGGLDTLEAAKFPFLAGRPLEWHVGSPGRWFCRKLPDWKEKITTRPVSWRWCTKWRPRWECPERGKKLLQYCYLLLSCSVAFHRSVSDVSIKDTGGSTVWFKNRRILKCSMNIV